MDGKEERKETMQTNYQRTQLLQLRYIKHMHICMHYIHWMCSEPHDSYMFILLACLAVHRLIQLLCIEIEWWQSHTNEVRLTFIQEKKITSAALPFYWLTFSSFFPFIIILIIIIKIVFSVSLSTPYYIAIMSVAIFGNFYHNINFR